MQQLKSGPPISFNEFEQLYQSFLFIPMQMQKLDYV